MARLIYFATQKEVKFGDTIVLDDETHTVVYFNHPHKPASSGKVSLVDSQGARKEYYVGVIRAEWVERTDQ